MAENSVSPVPAPSRVSFPALAAGLLLLLIHAGVSRIAGVPILRELTLFLGSALCVIGIIQRLKHAAWEFPARTETSAYIAICGAAAAGLAVGGLPETWGAARLLFAGVGLFAFGSAFLVLLPSLPRRILISLWILFHFGGMFTTFASIDPPGAQGPFLAKQAWTYVYRPYLSFLYLTNAYHFYSPNPGPPNLLWFAVRYSDGSYIWIRIPTREKGQISMHYQRLLALPEHSFSPAPRAPFNRAELVGLRADQYDEDRVWENIFERRMRGSGQPYAGKGRFIPWPGDMDITLQYLEPSDSAKLMLASVARRVFATAPVRPGLEVTSVKVYRVTHQLLSLYELSKGTSPFLKQKYWPFFMGEFDATGTLVDPVDPFLYWYLPIARVPANYPKHGLVEPKFNVPMVTVRLLPAEPHVELDGLELHAAGKAK